MSRNHYFERNFTVTQALTEAFELASSLADSEQDALAQWLKEEIEGERRWAALFARQKRSLIEAKAEFEAGRTTPLEF